MTLNCRFIYILSNYDLFHCILYSNSFERMEYGVYRVGKCNCQAATA